MNMISDLITDVSPIGSQSLIDDRRYVTATTKSDLAKVQLHPVSSTPMKPTQVG